MQTATMTNEEIQQRAATLYERIRADVETPENTGKILLLDVTSGDYEIAETGLPAAHRLKARRPHAELYGIRIGYDAVYTLGGTLQSTKR